MQRRPGRLRRRELAAATPATRDRVVDFVRAMSIGAVVFGHWFVATVARRGGELGGENVLSTLHWLEPATWVVQIIAIFFVVGGFSNERALGGPGHRDYGSFLARRCERLLRPTIVFTAVWLVLAVLLDASSVDPGLVHDAARIAAQPLWFLAVYVIVTALAPLQLRVHRARPWLLVVVLPVLVAGLDVLRLNNLAPDAAVANYVLVFLFAQELGFAYAEGRFARVTTGRALAVATGAGAVLVALTTVGPYPVSMVGVPGESVSNMSPPTFCILVLTIAQGGVLLATRPALARWLQRPAVWGATIAVNVVIMTVFLWHLTALVAAGWVAWALDALPPVATTAWWLERPLWFVGEVLVLVLLVIAFGPVERMPAWTASASGAPWRRVLGVLLAFRGLAGFALSGFDHAGIASGTPLLGTRVSPLVDLGLLAAGWLLACGPPPSPLSRRAPSPR